jgi:DNA-binding winged helix-turn-helix (wHTH) protein/tetratricopeptide (TPR) repeat protein
MTDRKSFDLGGVIAQPDRNALIKVGEVFTLEAKIMDVLCVLAENANDVIARDTLIDHVWGVEFGADESLTRAISILRKTFEQAGVTNAKIETIRKRGYRLVVDYENVKGSFVAGTVVNSSLNSERLSLYNKVRQGVSLLSLNGFPLWGIIFLILSIAVITYTFVIPSNRSMDSVSDNYVKKGHVDIIVARANEVSSNILQVSNLLNQKLLANISKNNLVIAEANMGGNSELGISGTVSKAGKEYTIQIETFLPVDGTVLTSKNYEIPESSVTDLERLVTIPVANSLSCAMSRMRYDQIVPKDAILLYLQSCSNNNRASIGSSGSSYAKQIYDLMPESASAMSNYAAAIVSDMLNNPSLSLKARHEVYEVASLTLARAKNIDAENPFVHLATALAKPYVGNWTFIEDQLTQTIALGINTPEIREVYSVFLRMVGRNQAAIAVLREDLRVRPQKLFTYQILTRMLASQGNMAQSDTYLDYLYAKSADRNQVNFTKFRRNIYSGRPEEALEQLSNHNERPTLLRPEDIACFRVLAEIQMNENISKDNKSSCSGLPLFFRIHAFAVLGDKQKVLEMVESLKVTSPQFSISFYHPVMQIIWTEPRFWQVLHKFGLADYWFEKGLWPDFCTSVNFNGNCETLARNAIKQNY